MAPKKKAPVKKGKKGAKGAKKAGEEHHDDLEAEEEKVGDHPAAEIIAPMAAVKIEGPPPPPPFQQALEFNAGQQKAARGKEDEKGKIPYFDTQTITRMEVVRKVNQNVNRRHMFIADQSSVLATSYEYNEHTRMISAHGEIKKCIIAKTQSKEEATANMRKDILSCMRRGEQSVLNIDTMVAMWKEYDMKQFFDFDKC